ncbi:coat protein [Papaya leaf curl virus [India:Pratapgarh3:2008]]|nr:coat protein [Papaya leaf curl virus [India:Pratapgarh3:2008]]
MSKRPADIIISTPASKVRRRLNFDSPYVSRVAAPIVRVTKAKAWANRPMNRKPRMYRMYRSPDVPRGCEGPCKIQSFESRHDIQHIGKVCVSVMLLVTGTDPYSEKRFRDQSVLCVRVRYDDENIDQITRSCDVFPSQRSSTSCEPQIGRVFTMFCNRARLRRLLRMFIVIGIKCCANGMQLSPVDNTLQRNKLSCRSYRVIIMLCITSKKLASMRIILRMLSCCIWRVLTLLTQCMLLCRYGSTSIVPRQINKYC